MGVWWPERIFYLSGGGGGRGRGGERNIEAFVLCLAVISRRHRGQTRKYTDFCDPQPVENNIDYGDACLLELFLFTQQQYQGFWKYFQVTAAF